MKRTASACAANASQTQKQAWEITSQARRPLETQAPPPPEPPSTIGNDGPDHPNAPRQSDVEVAPPPSARANRLERGLASIGGQSAGLGREASAIQTQDLRRTSTSRERSHYRALASDCLPKQQPHTIEPPTLGGGCPNEYARSRIAAPPECRNQPIGRIGNVGASFFYSSDVGPSAASQNELEHRPLRAEFTSKQRTSPKHLHSKSPRMVVL